MFVADRHQPVMHVLDAASGETIESFALESQERLYAGESGETVFVVQAEAGVTAAFSTGIAKDDHGDHADLDVTEPSALDAKIAGKKPVHFIAHHGEVAIFFDGEGVARIVREAAPCSRHRAGTSG